VEFVTDPVDETEEGLKLTQEILKSLTKFASTMETVLKEVGFQHTDEGGFWERLFADTHDENETNFGEIVKGAAGEDKKTEGRPMATVGYLAKKGQANAVSPDFWIMQSETKKVEAAPQVTGGIRLEKIPAAVGAIATDPGMRRIGDVNKDVETKELLTSVALARQASKTEKKPLDDRFIGFLSLLIAYLRVPVVLADLEKKAAAYPKDMPLLSRTNFGTLALAAAGRNEGLKTDAKEELPKEEGPKEQEPKKDEPKKEEPKKEPEDFKEELPKKGTPEKESHVESSAEWDFLQNPEKLWAAAGLNGSIQGRMFPRGYITTGGKENEGPTREEFLVGLAQGKDVFAGSTDAGQAAMGSMGMGAVAANPKAGEAQDRAILEFRRLPAPVAVSEWSNIAISLFKKICGINR
jgi:hypothetical protein